MSEAIETEQRRGALIITFNRPEIRSPLSVAVLEELKKIISDAAGRRYPPPLIFTGRDDVFASGADLREIAQVTAATAPEFSLRGQRLMRMIEDYQAPTAAAVNGYCFGGALDLALACKTRVASPNASFAHPGVGLGIMTGWGGTQRLPRLIGEAAALEIFLTAERVSAGTALRIGLVGEIAEDPVAAALARMARDSAE